MFKSTLLAIEMLGNTDIRKTDEEEGFSIAIAGVDVITILWAKDDCWLIREDERSVLFKSGSITIADAFLLAGISLDGRFGRNVDFEGFKDIED